MFWQIALIRIVICRLPDHRHGGQHHRIKTSIALGHKIKKMRSHARLPKIINVSGNFLGAFLSTLAFEESGNLVCHAHHVFGFHFMLRQKS